MAVATLVSPVGNYPTKLSRRESKVVEAAILNASHAIKFAGQVTSVSGDTTAIARTVTGVLSTDIVIATLTTQAASETLVKVAPTADTLTFTISTDAAAGTVISYMVLRATA